MLKIKIKTFKDQILPEIINKGDWIDLRAAESYDLTPGEYKLLKLGVAMQLPKGFEAHVVPRSSTFKNFGIILTNSIGIIDWKYNGDSDEWGYPAYCIFKKHIQKGDRICQFRIMENQPTLEFEEVEALGNKDRHGIGSTGSN